VKERTTEKMPCYSHFILCNVKGSIEISFSVSSFCRRMIISNIKIWFYILVILYQTIEGVGKFTKGSIISSKNTKKIIYQS